ncbi:PAS domain S-box protein [Nannocystaceae bacterium ST9]
MLAEPRAGSEFDIASPAFARAVLDAAPVIIVVLDAQGRILHYNDFMERLDGRPIAEVRGRDWFDEFLIDEERETIRALFFRMIDAGSVSANINYIRIGAGEHRLVEWYDRKLWNADGTLSAVVAVGLDISERVRAINERAEIARHFELFADRVDEVFFMTDASRTRVLYLSPAFERLTGISRERIYADPANLATLLHPDDRSTFLQAIGSPLPTAPAGQVEREYRILRPIAGREHEHELRWIWVRYGEVGLHAGEARVVGTLTDITERHESERALRELTEDLEARVVERTRRLEAERARLQQIIDGMAVFVGILDPEGYVRQINAQSLARMPDSIVGHRLDALPGMRYGERTQVELQAALARAQAGLPARVDLELGGSRSITDTFISPISGPDGRVLEIVVTGIDVTVRRAIEVRLRESLAELESKEARLADAQRIAAIGDWEWDIATDTLQWSEQVFHIFGREVGDFPKSYDDYLSLIHDVDRLPVMAAVECALTSDDHYEIEHCLTRPDGEVRVLLGHGEVTRDPQGAPLRMKGTLQDITRQKQVESELRVSLSEKEALLHEIHHRVKNNLQVVSSLLYLKGIDASAEIREVLDECSARIRSMALIHEQLYVSGQLARIEMRGFLARLGEELTRLFASDRAIHIQVSGEGLRLDIERAVPVALLANELLTNALKYAYPTLAPGQTAEVRVTVGPDLLEIADDGIGLPLVRSKPNSLGLRLVRSLARQLDAQLEFTGESGTCVRLHLPVAKSD